MNNDLKLITNSNINGDFLKNEFLKYAKNSEILIACPFFTNHKFLRTFIRTKGGAPQAKKR